MLTVCSAHLLNSWKVTLTIFFFVNLDSDLQKEVMALQCLPAIFKLHLQNTTSAAEAGKYVIVFPEVLVQMLFT